jgi:hypothetical protein
MRYDPLPQSRTECEQGAEACDQAEHRANDGIDVTEGRLYPLNGSNFDLIIVTQDFQLHASLFRTNDEICRDFD